MDNLEKLLYWRGIAPDYVNFRGEKTTVPLENRLRLLNAMGVNTDSAEGIAEQAYALDVEPWRNWLAPIVMVADAELGCFEINVAPSELSITFLAVITLEDGQPVELDFVPGDHPEVGDYMFEGTRYSRRAISIPRMPLGYHRLEVGVNGRGERQQAQYVVYPNQAYVPDWVSRGQRPWGLIIQLYTLRSMRNWGIGDFTDLKSLIRDSAASGVDMVGLNPLHALRTPVEHHCSPYSPSDRRFIDPLYIDPEAEPEYKHADRPGGDALNALRAQDTVAYAAVYRTKMDVLQQMFTAFMTREVNEGTERAGRYSRFVETGGSALHNFCLYQALAADKGKQLDQLSEAAKSTAEREYAEQVQFHAYLQWLADEQLSACQGLAVELGMKIGLMRDLAVGADGGGAEVVTNATLFRRDAAVGAPPDPLAEKGQNWGLPPMDPATLRQSRFRHFICLLRSNMHHCGALRIDHAMSLMRLWWCPPGRTADYGAYVHYPFREMLGLLNLESVRNRCLVIGEDMGVVPPEFRQGLESSQIFTNKLFYFEKLDDGRFRPPQDYDAHSLAMLTNHDVPTLASWWLGSDLELRQALDLLEEGADFQQVLKQRVLEKTRLLDWLTDLDLIKPEQYDQLLSQPLSHQLVGDILHGASRCGSQLFVVQLEDLELLEKPVNVPGTSYQYPNWQRKLEVPIEALFADERVQMLLRTIAQERG